MNSVPKTKFSAASIRPALAFVMILCGLRAPAAAISDDFSSGNDNTWSHLEPLAAFGAPGIYSFPSGGYRIQAAASPNPASLGSGRAGSLRLDLNLPDSFISEAYVLRWDNTLAQSFGVLGRITNPGFGTTKGYAFTYSTSGLLAISSINNETMSIVKSQAYQADPAKSYEMIFSGQGPNLFAEFNELLPSGLSLPVVAFGVSNSTFTGGFTGLEVLSNIGSGTADATFDTFRATSFVVPEPSTWALMTSGGLTLFCVLFRRPKASTNGRQTNQHLNSGMDSKK